MNRYVALLRAINVGGNSVVKMEKLRALFESCGFDDVRTYIQTGNVLFTSDETDAKKLAGTIEKKLESALGHHVTAFVLTPDELKDAAKHNPFEPERLEAKQRCHLMFLSENPDASRVEKLMALQGDEYRSHVREDILYYAYDREFDGHNRRSIDFEKVLGVTGSARTWKVVAKLIELTNRSEQHLPI